MADFEKIKDFIIDPSIREARAHVEVKRAMNPCPIDFSQFQSTNPRSNGIDKEYGEGEDASNFNIARKKYDDDEEPQFTASFGSGKGQLPVEPGRYRLIWSRHCPWANRIAIAIDLLGLDKVISKGVVDPLRPAGVVGGWYFTLDKDTRRKNRTTTSARPSRLSSTSRPALSSTTTTTTLTSSSMKAGRNTSTRTLRIFIPKNSATTSMH